MAVKTVRYIECAVCGERAEEPGEGFGFPGWGGLHGIELDGEKNPSLCPRHLAPLADLLDAMKREGD